MPLRFVVSIIASATVAITLASVTIGCAALRRGDRESFHFDPPSDEERRLSQPFGESEVPAQTGTYTDREGNTYAIDFDATNDQTLVETIDVGRGGPLTPTAAALIGETQGSEPNADEAEQEPRLAGVERPLIPNDGRRYLVLQWPMPATGVTSLFGRRVDPMTGAERYHYGVDLQGDYGQLIQAVGPGWIVFAGWNAGHGRMVIIEHPGGWRSSYSHLSQQTVTQGSYVQTGQAVGQMGNSGRSTGPHLHLEITRWGAYHDPLDLLGTAVPLE